MLEFNIRGCRGTTPACKANFLKYGGSTTCFTAETAEGVIIVDAGTGIYSYADQRASSSDKRPITLLLTHMHLDHILGLPSFDPIYFKQTDIEVMADPGRTIDWKQSLRNLISPPYWPVGICEAQADIRMKDLPSEENSLELYGMNVSWFNLPHPQQCLAYRISDSRNSVVIATDAEYTEETLDPAFIEFCRDTDYLIFDAQFTPGEYEKYRGWGHSTWKTATIAAEAAGAGNLVLTHHDPAREDREIDQIVIEAKEHFSNTTAASERSLQF